MAWRLALSPRPRGSPRPGALRRGLIAGSAWGIVTGALVVAAGAWECGGVCVPDAAVTMATSVLAGLATMGPLAALGARPHRDVTAIAPYGRALS
jgi:uncharacterized membrane protein YhaH (DUF805 family)